MNLWNMLFNTVDPSTIPTVDPTAIPTADPSTIPTTIATMGGVDGPTAVTEATELFLQFEPFEFVRNLSHMGTSMLTIFIVIGVIILATVLINKLSSKK